MMQQVKLFKGIESELTALEDKINSWIRESHVKVLQISGNIAPQSAPNKPTAGQTLARGSFEASDVLIVISYESD